RLSSAAMVTMIAKRCKIGLEKFKEFFLAQVRLLENPMLEQRRRNILAVDRNRYVKSRLCTMEQPRVASLLVMNVKTGAQQTSLGLRTGSFGGMPSGGYGTVTATLSVVTSARSVGIGSPVNRT